MLSIGKLTVEQSRYYERQVADGRDDYYSGRGESSGRWTGSGAEVLGVGDRVDDEGFMALMDGRDPGTGERLRRVGGRSKVAAFDLTFSAPKSVSVLFAIGEPTLAGALVEAHESAVDAAVGYLEREACRVRRGRGGVRREVGEGFVAAAYRHRMSRAEDPQLHTHVVAANMARGKRDKLELYELRHACATLLMERGLPPHVVANQLGHTDGGALVQRLYGHPSERGMRDQVRLAFAGWGADGEQRRAESPGDRGVSRPL